MTRIECPKCGAKYAVKQEDAGKKYRCKCGEPLSVPGAAASAGGPAPAPTDSRKESPKAAVSVAHAPSAAQREAPKPAPAELPSHEADSSGGRAAGSQWGSQVQEIARHAEDPRPSDRRKAGQPGDIGHAVKIILGDPMGGQSRAAGTLGETRTLILGVLLCAAFAIILHSALLHAAREAAGSDVNLGSAMKEFSGSQVAASSSASRNAWDLKEFLVCALPALGLILGFFAIGKVMGESPTLGKSVLAAGMTLLPITVFALLLHGFTKVSATGNAELLAIIGVFVVFCTILLMYAALEDLMDLTSTKAFFMCPVLAMVVAYITKVLFVQLVLA